MYDITHIIKQKNIMNDLSFPRLVSYPRTGSHWLRILVEKYTGIPSVLQSFFDPYPQKVWGFHIHDREIGKFEPSEGPTTNLKKVIYLYRDPVDTIYSQMKYHKDLPFSWDGKSSDFISKKVEDYIEEYFNHMNRWLKNNQDIELLLIIKYEDIQKNSSTTCKKVIDFLNFEWDEEKFENVYKECDKFLTKRVTPHDHSALNPEEIFHKDSADNQRNMFKLLFKDKIEEKFKEFK